MELPEQQLPVVSHTFRHPKQHEKPAVLGACAPVRQGSKILLDSKADNLLRCRVGSDSAADPQDAVLHPNNL